MIDKDRRALVQAATAMGQAVQKISQGGPPPDERSLALLFGDLHCLSTHLARLLVLLEQHMTGNSGSASVVAGHEQLIGPARDAAGGLAGRLGEVVGHLVVGGRYR